MSSSFSRALNGPMFKSGGIPSLMLKKISPSVPPCCHSASVRSGDGGLMSLPDPPVAFTPWHGAHVLVKSAFPAAIDSGVDITGFLTAACAGSPCAANETAASHTITAIETPARVTRDSPVRSCAMATILGYFLSPQGGSREENNADRALARVDAARGQRGGAAGPIQPGRRHHGSLAHRLEGCGREHETLCRDGRQVVHAGRTAADHVPGALYQPGPRQREGRGRHRWIGGQPRRLHR